jgi:cysteine desulfurase/selenocysteine lyase
MSALLSSSPPMAAAFDVHRVRRDFPILQTTAHGHPLIYLDNGATTQKPRQVIDAIHQYYESQNANIHRGVYQLSQTATRLYEQSRGKVAAFINAEPPKASTWSPAPGGGHFFDPVMKSSSRH